MAEKKRVATFSPTRAKAINDFINNLESTGERVYDQGKGRVYSKKTAWAKITDSAANGTIEAHAWVEVRWNFSTNEFEETPDGKSGTTEHNYVVNHPDPTTALNVDDIVFIARQEDATTGGNRWVVASSGAGGSLPTAEYQYMVYQMVTNNGSGWDFVRANPFL